MRGLNPCPVVLAAWLAAAGTVQAGVYLLEPVPTLLPPLHQPGLVFFENVRQERENQQSAHDRNYGKDVRPPRLPTPSREYYLQLAARLEKQRKEGFFSARDAVTLSGCLLRLGRPEGSRDRAGAAFIAEEALSRLGPRDPYRFLLTLNLACAYFQQNDLQMLSRAIERQREALRAWPEVWAGWDREQLRWQRRVEQLTLTLMRLRLREELDNRGQATAPPPPLDPLFDTPGQKVRFVGPSGSYEAGALTFEEENKLPRDAEHLVIALVRAYPYDHRLYWLYGELLNARGQVKAARVILDGLVGIVGSGGFRGLAAHRRVLFADEAGFILADPDNRDVPLRKLFWAVAPRGHLLAGPLVDMSHEVAWLAVIGETQGTARLDDGETPPVPGSPATADRLPSWREISIGFAAGVVVGLLAALQWLEWRRRRRGSHPE